jgi:hypothetical protein
MELWRLTISLYTVILKTGGYMLERETAFYQAHKVELRKEYHGKYLVIIGEKVLGAYDTNGEAYRTALKTEQPGQFMIEFIPEDPEDEVYYLSPLAYV